MAIIRTLQQFIKKLFIATALVLTTTYGWNFLPSPDPHIHPSTGTPERLKATVHILSDEIGVRNFTHYDNLNKAADFITSSLSSLGYSPKEQNFTTNNQNFRNIFAMTSISLKKEYILIGAHYDSCFTKGADDNASGIAGLLELARLLKNQDLKTPIIFVAFSNEEPPFFTTDGMGSLAFAHQLKKNGITVKGAIILEMIGYYTDQKFSQKYLPPIGPFYPNAGNFIAVVGNFPSSKLVHFIHNDFRKNQYFPMYSIIAPEFIPGIYFSDHWSFWQEKYPAVMITDTAYLRNKNYHQPTDVLATLNFTKMAYIITGIAQTIVKLSNETTP